MFQKFIFPLLFIFSAALYPQKKWTQQEIDSFIDNKKLTRQNVEEYKAMLLSNDKLKGWSKYYSTMAHKKYVAGENDIANRFADSALNNPRDPKLSNLINEHSTMQANYIKSLIARANENFEESTKFMLRALELEKKYPYKYKSYFRATIANNHLSLGNNEKALEYYYNNLSDTAYTNLAQPHVVTLSRIGLLFTENYLNNRDSAYAYLKKAENTSFQKGYKDYLPFIYSYLGRIFRETNKDSAIHYFKLSKREFETYSVVPNISPKTFKYEMQVNNAFISLHEGNNGEVISELTPMISELENYPPNKMSRDILLDGYDCIILAFQNLNMHKMESQYLKKKISFLNDFHEEELQSELEKISVAYETKEKEEQIDQLRLESENKDLLVSKKKYQLAVISISAGILMLLTLLFFRNKLMKNKFQKVSLEQQLLRTQMNPHFIYNVMQSIAILIDKTPAKAKKFIVKFGSLLRLYLENSRNEYVQLEDEIDALKKYLAIYSEMVKEFEYEIAVDEAICPEETSIPPMLIQPLVENAIKHGIKPLDKKPGKIKIELKPMNKKFLVCTVSDNGLGFKDGKKSAQSLAMQIIDERLTIYHGIRKRKKIKIIDKNQNKNGLTTVSIDLPYLV